MKKSVLLVFALILAVGSTFAQRKVVTTLDTDTIANTTPVYSEVLETKLADHVNIQVLATQIGGTSDGTAEIQASVDGTSYLAIGEQDGFVSIWPVNSDTLTITNGAIWNIAIKNNPYKYLRLKFTGTANDTTQLVTKYTIAK